jgi:hypothetical protein
MTSDRGAHAGLIGYSFYAKASARAVQIVDNANSISALGTFNPKSSCSASMAAAIV